VAGGSGNRGNRGKGPGNQPLTQAQIAANDARAKLQAEEAELKLLEIQAKKAEAQARFDKAKSGASSVTAASTPLAQGGRGGGVFVTYDQFQAGINDLNGAITKGFDQVLSNQSIAAQQQALTNATLAGFVKMMGTNSTGFSLPAPVSRQIGNGPQENSELQRHISYGQNAGFDPNAARSGMSVTSSSQLSQSVVASGGGSASNSSQFVISKEAPTFFRESSGGSSIVAARQLGVSHSLTKFASNFARMKPNDFNTVIGNAIRSFVASFAQSEQDEMACVLLAMVNGKKYPAHNHIIIQSNESVFGRFFGELATKFPINKCGQQCSFPFNTLSTDQSAMCVLIRVLRGED
jgi:hypothetical protein